MMVSEPKEGKGEIVLYQTSDGQAVLEVRLEQETVWLTQKQMAELLDTERSVITKHIRNVFRSGELREDSVGEKFAHTAAAHRRKPAAGEGPDDQIDRESD